jgi:1-acyl-sn-glycerol-3-phosphate acyltransferase
VAETGALPGAGGAEGALSRGALVGAIITFLAGQHPRTLVAMRHSLEHAIDNAGPDALARLGERLAGDKGDWDYYPPDPLARRIHHVLAERILKPGSGLVGLEHLEALAGKPIVIFANHLSYSDANLLEVLLHRAGGASHADRLTVIAGPKVYSSIKRRFSSLCFGTIKTPQNSGVSSEDAVMNARDVARAARRSIDAAHERLGRGDALLVFAEGTRSRTNGLQQILAGGTRYLDHPDTVILPAAITGGEALFPIGADTLHSVQAVTRLGRPIAAAALRTRSGGNRQLMMDCVGLAIAELLPPDYRGVFGGHTREFDEARRVLSKLRES